MADLLPCPFCGGEAEQDFQQAYRAMQTGRIDHGAAVYCTGCNANMIMCRGDHPELSDDERMTVMVEDWNRRTPTLQTHKPSPGNQTIAGETDRGERCELPPPQSNVEGIHLTLTRALGMYGAAYDPPGPHRAYTYEHQPGNGVAWNLGCAVSALKQHYSGDAIDVGLYLLKEMQARGLGVFEVEPKAVEAEPSTQSNARGTITPQMIRDTAGWEQMEDELRETLRHAANALESTEAERAEQWRLRREAEGSRDAVKAAADTLRIERDNARSALKLAIDHIEHMAGWFGGKGTGYSFESLGEDMPGIKAALTGKETP
ncbi:Lar family restriction alleviation protein [Ciceribacter thiooxidans]|uniref:Lar family restriction alleviation protein n=1 Tax=Ciceribacter thiooxidans TaxID=1969821 RepID=A0ABV7I0C4_9HYPH|nr:Lar family restriction alleviation protein [Ciceribacter thiooxidans]